MAVPFQWIIGALLSILSVAGGASFHVATGGASFHVATSGSDANTGTVEHPFVTLQRTRDAARTAKGSTVIIHGGTYIQTQTLELNEQDSGTFWKSADNEQVHIVGGPLLRADAFAAITDSKVVSRLPESARAHVLRFDLHSVGELEVGTYPDTFRGAPATPELFFNGKRMTIARWPNQGWATVAKFVDSGSIPREGDSSNRPGVFEYSGDEPARWNVDACVWLQGYWCYDWYDETIKVRSIDQAHRTITMASPALYGIKQGNPSPRRFRAINLLEELDEPGEFYIDRESKILYFWPPGSLDGARILFSTLNGPLLRLNEAHNVAIHGLNFEAGLADGIEIRGGHDNLIDGCTVRNVRQLAIEVLGGTNHRVASCTITDTGAGGINLKGGDRKTLSPANHQATNSHISNFSRHQLTHAYAITLDGVGNRTANNHIQFAPHQAVFINGNDHIFEFNEVDHVVTETDDAGAVYKGRNPSCRGNIIRSNLFHDIGSSMGHGTAAVYFDDGDGGDFVFGNIFLRCGFPGAGSFGTIFSHGGHDNRAENNIFIDCKRPLGSAPWDDARWKDALAGGQDLNFTPKLLQEVDITKPPYTTRYPELVGFMNPQPGQARNNHAKNNVFVRCDLKPNGNWQCPDAENFTTDKDPGFVNASANDFRLRPDAEILKRLPNFKPIPFEKIGVSRNKETP